MTPRRLLSFVFGVAAFAQAPDSAAVRGRIADQTGAVLTGVQIEVTNPETGLRRTAASDATGQYGIGQLPLAAPTHRRPCFHQ